MRKHIEFTTSQGTVWRMNEQTGVWSSGKFEIELYVSREFMGISRVGEPRFSWKAVYCGKRLSNFSEETAIEAMDTIYSLDIYTLNRFFGIEPTV